MKAKRTYIEDDFGNGDNFVSEEEAEKLEAETERLQAIVDKLPTTADGVAVLPGMTVWVDADYGDGLKIWELVVDDLSMAGAWDGARCHWGHFHSYSTREACEAAVAKNLAALEE